MWAHRHQLFAIAVLDSCPTAANGETESEGSDGKQLVAVRPHPSLRPEASWTRLVCVKEEVHLLR